MVKQVRSGPPAVDCVKTQDSTLGGGVRINHAAVPWSQYHHAVAGGSGR